MTVARGNQKPGRRSRHARRAEGFAVRRWLQLGAASAGMGAALLGYSLLSPQVGVAGAETGDTSAVSTGASTSDAAERDGTASDTTGTDTDTETATDDTDVDTDVGGPAGEDDNEAVIDDTAEIPDGDATGGTASDDTDAQDAAPDTVADSDSVVVDAPAEPVPGSDRQAADESVAPASAEPTDDAPAVETGATQHDSSAQFVSAQLSAPTVPAPRRTWREIVGDFLDKWTADTQAWIDSRDVDDETKARMEANFLAMRRALFNQAPTVEPIQITGKLTGAITGTLAAVDADGDRLVYRVVRAPREGSLQLNQDGTYTYTPDSDFDGVDTFRVVAIDVGLHMNLLDLFRPIGTRVSPLINQGAIKFDFQYNTGAEYWTEDRRGALQDAADALIVYFVVGKPVVLTYNVTGMEDAESSTLASAGSNLIRTGAGFWRTVVQNKLLTGYDSNGSAADGRITWNFGAGWGLGEDVDDGDFDFASTAMHELLHSFGFLSLIGEAGDNDNTYWTVFDSFVVNEDGRRPINRRYRFDSDFDPILTGEDGGMWFGGYHAVKAYGGLVPIFSPDPWNEGSSGSHLDDFTFSGDDQLMMNAQTGTGPGVRVLSAIEIGILRDLGYQVDELDPQTSPLAMALLGVVFLGRLRRKSAGEHAAQ
ncbi:Ig-like domain-containing protein [Mycobacterium sp. 4D054]|uniref:Ig-like domain-containing protein n=1 Tax=Mycobacterium sp. 4D054 TaxID=3457440 RepID=UPI003FD3D8C2